MTELLAALHALLGVQSTPVAHRAASVSSVSCSVKGCVHTRRGDENHPKGKDLVLTLEACRKGLIPACKSRIAFLQRLEGDFLQWLENKGRVGDVVQWRLDLLSKHFCPEGEVGYGVGDEAPMARVDIQREELGEEKAWEARLDRKAEKAGYNLADRLAHAHARIEALAAEQRLVELFQDLIEETECQVAADIGWKVIFSEMRQVGKLLDVAYKQRKLSFDSFAELKNQICEFMGWQPMNCMNTRSCDELLVFWSSKIDSLHKQAVEEEGRVLERGLNTLEVDADLDMGR